MNDDRSKKGFRPLADPAAGILDPVLRKRAGITIELVQAWEEVVGSALGATIAASQTCSGRAGRMRMTHFNQPRWSIACQGFTAMRIQHETGEIISRVNAFLGLCSCRADQDRAEACGTACCQEARLAACRRGNSRARSAARSNRSRMMVFARRCSGLGKASMPTR